MSRKLSVLSFLVVGLAVFAGSIQTASAESIVRAIYRVSLTDPATGSVFYTDRQSLRSWPSEERCKMEKESFSGFHVDRVAKQNFMNEEGASLQVKMASAHCVTVRE